MTEADPATVLVVEDDASLNAALSATLKAAGFRPVTARTAAEGLRWFAHYAPDLVLLDLGLPDRDGLSVIRDIRAKAQTPIVVLSARNAEAMKVEALDLGADDYVTKPFAMDELLARIRVALRRTEAGSPSTLPPLRTAHFELDFAERRAVAGGAPVRLTPTEWSLLEVLARHTGHLVPQRDLLREVWGPGYGRESNYLRVYANQLRRKLEPDPTRPRHLLTEPGQGYRLVAAQG